MNKILILGASGFIGNTLYKELLPYFDVYGTYCSLNENMLENQVLFKFNAETDTISILLNKIKPNYIISSLRGDFKALYKVHQQIYDYVKTRVNCCFLFLSTVNVFDGKFAFPSYENDTLLAESEYGKYKISVERMFYKLPKKKYLILRLPMVLGVNSPRVYQLKQASIHNAVFEVFPNLIISITTVDKIAQQIHYIINKKLKGIYHLATNDVIHHSDLFQELAKRLELKKIIFTQAYTSNEDRYLAILPKVNKLPKTYRISVAQVIEYCTLKEEIKTLKN